MDRTITVGGRDIKVRMSLATLASYRRQFGRDMLTDMNAMGKGDMSVDKDGNDVIGRTFYVCAKDADPDQVPNTINEFFESLPLDVSYINEVVKMWEQNMLPLKKK